MYCINKHFVIDKIAYSLTVQDLMKANIAFWLKQHACTNYVKA